MKAEMCKAQMKYFDRSVPKRLHGICFTGASTVRVPNTKLDPCFPEKCIEASTESGGFRKQTLI